LKNLGTAVDSPAAAAVGRWLYYVLPNFAAFDLKSAAVHGLPIAPADIAWTLVYAVVYITLLVVASAVIFSRRDFK
jgi:hypothetical protein